MLTSTTSTRTIIHTLASLFQFGQCFHRQSALHCLIALTVGTVASPLLLTSPVQAAESSFAESMVGEVGETLAQLQPELAEPLPVDGFYLYGQSPEPNQLGSAYMVFEARNGLAVGAFYMPNSSFDCFYGSVQPTEMALTVVDSYSLEAFPYEVALESADAVANVDGSSASLELDIEGFHQLPELSESDHEILSVCQADVQEQVW